MEVDENEAESSKKTKIKTHLSKKEKKELDRLEELAIKRAEQRVIEGNFSDILSSIIRFLIFFSHFRRRLTSGIR